MKNSLYLLLFCVCNMACDDEDEFNEKRKKILGQLTKTGTVMLDDYRLVGRQVVTDVRVYRSYRSVSAVFYSIMRDVSDARFTFQAERLHINAIGSCEPQDVIIKIKHGSYPALNPDGYAFPKGFVDPNTRDTIYTIKTPSDGTNTSYSILNPKPGYWYALVYRKWEDPRIQKVEQEGLAAKCHTNLYTDLQVKREHVINSIDCIKDVTVSYPDLPATFKCITVDSVRPVTFRINVINKSGSDASLLLLVQALSLPSVAENLRSCYFNPKDAYIVHYIPHPNAWHYIKVDRNENNTKIRACDRNNSTKVGEFKNHTVLDLMRDSMGRFFTFEYGLPTTNLEDVTSLINVTSGELKSVRFEVSQILDVGGTLTLEASLFKTGLLSGLRELVICLDIGHTSVPLKSGHCEYNDQTRPALFVLNSVSIHSQITIPFPESGFWYLTFRLFCDSVECSCRSDNGTYNVSADVLERETEDLGDASRAGSTECNASVILEVESAACVGGRCQNRGKCLLNPLGGLTMSFCSCPAGFGAWDCSDDSRTDKWAALLSLSNLLFLLSVYSAAIRLYYTEAVMYAFTMVLSALYHAFDMPMQGPYGRSQPPILQYGDFYCGIMCFWVTLLAMSIMHDKLRSALQLIGAITVALLTTWNMHSIFAFMLPVAFGCAALLASWGWDWHKTRSLRYKRTYYTRFLPTGIVLVGVGLVCYAFLQTEQNYKTVHSLWHVAIAVSVVFLLPDVRRDPDAHPFLPTDHFCKLPLWRRLYRSQTPLAVE